MSYLSADMCYVGKVLQTQRNEGSLFLNMQMLDLALNSGSSQVCKGVG